ncbi:MAG: tetratricopeptide repeat protein [Cyanobacteria bacterium J055]|nr:MAG: tetratricopeptide repeat protein [Cyanobacteria bacterium J055]
MHPVIREMAIDRLRQNKEDLEQANRKAAEFWTDSVEIVTTQEDATRALEAYYHYVEIENFDRAAQVINYPRFYIDYTELLGISFYRLGLLSQIVLSIEFIVDKVSFGYDRSRLYNILGDSYWMTGNIHKSIKCTLKSQDIANNVIQNANIVSAQELSKIKNLYLTSFYNVGFCELALGNYERSLEIFKSLPETYQDPNCPPEYKIGYCFILSYLYSKVFPSKYKIEILEFAKESYVNPQSVDSWCIGYRYLFLGLTYKNIAEIEKAFEMFSDAIKFADRSNYTQVKAKALTGLGELYRIQGDYAKAIPLHQESIDLLDKIRAKCDLAEAYFQCALTYQEMGETENSQENFDKALKLFREIEAPRQIERVQSARKTD